MGSARATRDDRIRSFDFDLNQLLLELVLHSHPEWQQPDGSCPDCWSEVRRLRQRPVRFDVLDA